MHVYLHLNICLLYFTSVIQYKYTSNLSFYKYAIQRMSKKTLKQLLIDAFGQSWAKKVASEIGKSDSYVRQVFNNDLPDRNEVRKASIILLKDYHEEQQELDKSLMELSKKLS